MTAPHAPLTLAVHTVGRSLRDELAADVRRGLGMRPMTLPPRWFYDERGSELFEQITELPEYYQTRTEASILRAHVADIVAMARPEEIVELGAGSCTKTRLLLDATRRAGSLRSFTPFDVSDAALWHTAQSLVGEFPGLVVYGMVGDFAAHLSLIPRLGGRRLVVFLGSTIGNFEVGERRRFLDEVRGLLQPGDAFLLGVDLVKARDTLIAAYDDAAGVTAEFNRNVLRVVNRELEADFDLDAFEHLAVWNAPLARIEMHLRARTAQTVHIPGADMRVELDAGETVRTEISAKFTRDSAAAFLAEAGMRPAEWFTDPEERFAVVVATPA